MSALGTGFKEDVVIRIDRHQWRVYVLRRRLHHGFVGSLAVAAGLTAMYHDRADWRRWFRFN